MSVTCSILSDNVSIVFAKEELLKYIQQVEQPIPYSFVLGLEQEFTEKGLVEQTTLMENPTVDAFQIVQKGNEIYIIGSNPRSVLYGVYHTCKKLFGYKWVHFLSEEKVDYKDGSFIKSSSHRGKMVRRGLVIENYEDTSFLLQMIDWAAKHYINELFFTFMLWDKVKPVIEKEIEKRGLTITIGGHSMHYLLSDISILDKEQINYSDDSWKDLLIDKIKNEIDKTSSIKRVSLWPADIGIKDDQDFLTKYIAFTEQLKKQIPRIEVEHIAYNAGLSWDMLELPDDLDSSKTVDTLFAFWGRNYQQSFKNEEKGFEALHKWCQATKTNQKDITIFEYYSDHFMLGNLFPPLFQRIHEDINLYSQLGINQIVNLIVPYFPKENTNELDYKYPWESIQQMNSYYFARLTWGDGFDEIEGDFYSIFNEHQNVAENLLKKMESVLSEVSKWNFPLFPSRVIDPEKVTECDDLHLIITDLNKWKNELEPFKGDFLSEIKDPSSMITFYIFYVCQMLEHYLAEWMEKIEIVSDKLK
ncbi:hypothetical protein RGU12_00780 [Fredinandcohnia sp. QZ13]|uniref:hypothetical protein n=1 Tax=Fredinandcohnia sp. QZ13 TaxID=3073144 RepID=UPI0028535607|nr:hypothetical protein [Fredinandcohnia sp. QZ13]MDR4886078.1 hypothetical protein [Fredinandcohnia sp. QZ13]